MTSRAPGPGRRPGHRLAAVLASVVVAAVACGGGSAAAPTTTTTTTTAPTTTTTTAPPPTSPLTGEVIDPALLARKALVVKIDNHERARPQSGLGVADVVYEEMVEGKVTRFAAVFHSTDTDVGPVRSARTSDVAILAPLGRPLFAWSGANGGVRRQIRAADIIDVGYDAAPSAYRRVSGRPAPHNLYTSTAALFALQPPEEQGPPPAQFRFRDPEDPPPAGTPVEVVRVDLGFPQGYRFDWHWDPDREGWGRVQLGTVHVDATGEVVKPTNVIIQFTPYRASGFVDSGGATSPEAVLVGEGDAWILTAGRLVEARWSRSEVHQPTTYRRADDGTEVALTPGRTWVVLAPPGTGRILEPAAEG